jgi:hypothetical protein
LAFFEFLSCFSVPTADSIVFGNENNDNGKDLREFAGDCLFTSVNFTVNHDLSSSLFAHFKGSKPESGRSETKSL